MQFFLNWLDRIGGIQGENLLAKWLERIAFFFLILMTLAAPLSIAATQTAWLAGMFVWVIRLLINPRPKLVRTPLAAPLWTLFGWSVLTAVFSYAPDISIDKLRNAALFLIFYFIINVVRTKRAVFFLAFALIFSATIVSLWTPIERVIGRGTEISDLKPNSPLAKALLMNGDTLLEADKKKIRQPQDLVGEIEQNETVSLVVYRQDYSFEVKIKRADLLGGETALEKLGIGAWKPSHSWRAQGFFSHFTTFAEVLQLVMSLAFGLFIALISKELTSSKENRKSQIANRKSKILQPQIVFLALCLAIMTLALLLSETRASQGAFLVSALAIVLINGNRKLIYAAAAVLLPLALAGVFIVRQNRQIGIIDPNDNSTQYRMMMWRDGLRLWTTSARNFVFGVGMDSIKRYWREWDLFDKGTQPMGHFHSTPIQLAVERGFPAVIFWFWILWVYARTLWRNLKSEIKNPKAVDWRERGITLGAFGGLAGFFASGWVHYNYGDAVVVMAFFIVMGLSVRLMVNGKWLMVNGKYLVFH